MNFLGLHGSSTFLITLHGERNLVFMKYLGHAYILYHLASVSGDIAEVSDLQTCSQIALCTVNLSSLTDGGWTVNIVED